MEKRKEFVHGYILFNVRVELRTREADGNVWNKVTINAEPSRMYIDQQEIADNNFQQDLEAMIKKATDWADSKKRGSASHTELILQEMGFE